MDDVKPIQAINVTTVRRVSDETRRKQSLAHSGAKHHFFGSSRLAETKDKIAESLRCTARLDFDTATLLPRYMKTVTGSEAIGYSIVGHPATPLKRFEFSSLPRKHGEDDKVLGVLRERCVFYLNHLNECSLSDKTPTSKIIFMRACPHVV